MIEFKNVDFLLIHSRPELEGLLQLASICLF